MQILAFGHYGPPLIAFPLGGGQFFYFENNGMIQAIQHLIEDGKVKVCCFVRLITDNRSYAC